LLAQDLEIRDERGHWIVRESRAVWETSPLRFPARRVMIKLLAELFDCSVNV